MSLEPFILLYSKQPTLLHFSDIYCCHHRLAGWFIIVFVLILELGVILFVASCRRAIALTQRLLARWVPKEPPWWLFCWKRERATMRTCSQATTSESACIWQKATVTAIFLALRESLLTSLFTFFPHKGRYLLLLVRTQIIPKSSFKHILADGVVRAQNKCEIGKSLAPTGEETGKKV